MSHLAIYILALAALRPAAAVGTGLQDLASLPKFQVNFLNELPIAESDAAAIRTLGLRHEDEFLALHPGRGEPEPREPPPGGRGVIDGAADADAGGEDAATDAPSEGSTDVLKTGEVAQTREAVPEDERIALVPMLYTHPATPDRGPHPYLCAMPSANTTGAQTAIEEPVDESEPDPEASWRALGHLDGQCLYLRLPHSWFTYAYCHNKDIRQFREKAVPHPHPEGFVPREDPDFDAYTLGIAQVPHRNEETASLGQSHASRYLVQTWTDGTRCDLTGRPREIEVQVYCSMTGTDMIYMVNEVAICQYVMVIHSPHLCSLPGFRPATALDITPAPVRCREVVPDEEFEQWAERREAAAAEPEDGRRWIGEKEEEGVDARLASEETDPELKIDGLSGISEEDLAAILAAAFGGFGSKEDEKTADAQAQAEAQADASGEAQADSVPPPELYVVNWEDTDGVRVPVDVESVPPTEGDSRRAFLERLHALIEKELGAEGVQEGKEGRDGDESESGSGSGRASEHRAKSPEGDAPPVQRDEL